MAGPARGFIVATKYAPYGLVPVGAPVSVTTAEVMMTFGFFRNASTTATAIITITDKNDLPIIAESIRPGGTFKIDTEFSIFQGLKWGCSAALYGQLTAYPTT